VTGSDEPQAGGLARLWATWRMAYLKSLEVPDSACVFCEITREEDSPANLVVYRGTTCYIVMNLYPYTNGHAMVVPFRHVASLADLSDEERCEMMRLAALLQRALTERVRAHGFNLGMNLGRAGGAGIPDHLHLHVVPRWTGDTNFMPVVGETKVLPEALEVTWNNVREALREIVAREEG